MFDTITRDLSLLAGRWGVTVDLQWSDRPDMADVTTTMALRASKSQGRAPKVLAQEACDLLIAKGYAAHIAGPGFINIKLTSEALVEAYHTRQWPSLEPKRVVLDYGGPNVAKPMHVGHLRSLLLGESLKRILTTCGQTVISDIHWGDWGLQMGMLIVGVQQSGKDPADLRFDDFASLYPMVSHAAKTDPAFKLAAQKATTALQGGAVEETAIWKRLVTLTKTQIIPEIARLGVSFHHWKGESDVSGLLSTYTNAHLANGVAVVSDGAVVIPVEGDVPLILRNSEGSYLYGATDLCTIVNRLACDGPDEIIYVVDQRQALHFKQVFESAAKTLPPVKLTHVGFGTVNGPDGRPLKTRDGGTPKLGDLISDAFGLALERNPDPMVAERVAMAALKFADLSTHRLTNYQFDLERFVSFEGRTGPYMCYQFVRMINLLSTESWCADDIEIMTDDERLVIITLIKYREAVEGAGQNFSPNLIADYAYALAQAFSVMYANGPIRGSPSRVALANEVKDHLGRCLYLLGIDPPAKM